MNMNNFGILEGRVTREPAVFPNSDGSSKVRMTIAVKDNFKSGANSEKQSQFINVEAFVPADRQANNVYQRIHEGSLIGVQYSVRSNQYEKNGETIYTQVLMVESVDLKESKAVTDARVASKAAAAAAAAAQA